MNRSHVTLPQILVAASTRHASMVPESAGYLVLALCDAIGCLPLAVPDASIELAADGSVTVTEQGKVCPGPEAARAMRDLFARLLAVTTGPTPRLAAVARTRDVSAEKGIDTFAAEVEAALVPLNRAAGKRSLGRLARETLRAIESGALALHLQARAAAKEAPAAATAALAPLLIAPTAAAKPAMTLPEPAPIAPPEPAPITPPPSMTAAPSELNPFSDVTPTTPGLGLETLATEAHVDSGVFGATPTYREGDCIAVEPADAKAMSESPGFDSTNTKTVSCEPTQLSAREVQIEPAQRTPSSDPTMRIVSTKRRVRRIETPRSPVEITLASAGVEPISERAVLTPAPSSPETAANAAQAALDAAMAEFNDCHDGQTQSAPKYHETLPGLAPVSPVSTDDDAEPLQSFEYQLVTPSALPMAAMANAPIDIATFEEGANEPQEIVLSSRLLVTAPPSRVVDMPSESGSNAPEHSPAAFQALDVPSEEPGRVDELLGTFGRPEEGEDEMLRKTASSLKELAGLEPTPCAPSVSPAIRVPVMTHRATPAWLPEDPRNATALEPAPLVRASRSLRARLRIPFALFIALFAGFAVVHWRLPDVVIRWIQPAAKQTTDQPVHATAEQEVYLEP
ncbi:MAG: hypothetical protein IPM54_00380 [Polyangiaceae bacterium]|nr:hypothetical protein [Polyangiaceae bacterium]